MSQLISLISTHGKKPGQAVEEAWQAYLKFQKVSNKVIKDLSTKKDETKENLTLEDIQALNEQAKQKGELLEEGWGDKDLTQVIFFRKNPKYKPPVKK